MNGGAWQKRAAALLVAFPLTRSRPPYVGEAEEMPMDDAAGGPAADKEDPQGEEDAAARLGDFA